MGEYTRLKFNYCPERSTDVVSVSQTPGALSFGRRYETKETRQKSGQQETQG
jgi:hypothetical protein